MGVAKHAPEQRPAISCGPHDDETGLTVGQYRASPWSARYSATVSPVMDSGQLAMWNISWLITIKVVGGDTDMRFNNRKELLFVLFIRYNTSSDANKEKKKKTFAIHVLKPSATNAPELREFNNH